MSKLKLFLILASALLISCANPNDPNNGNDTGTGGGGNGGGGGNANPSWYLSDSEQKTPKMIHEKTLGETVANAQYYRIPAVLVTKNNTIVVAFDNRKTKNADIGFSGADNIEPTVRRSTDGGKTWSENIRVGDVPTTKINSHGDPVLFEHTPTGNLVMLSASGGAFAWQTERKSRIAVSISKNDGLSWSKWTEVQGNMFDSGSKLYNAGYVKGFAASGRGTTLRDGTLVCTLLVTSQDGYSKKGAATFYSKDGGSTWQVGGIVQYPGNAFDEPKIIAELVSGDHKGKLLMTARPNQTGKDRYWAVANGVNDNWTKVDYGVGLTDGRANAEGVRYTLASEGHAKDRLLFLNCNSSTERTQLTLHMSEDEGKTWNAISKKVIQPGRSCYSSIDVLGDGTIITFAEEPSKASALDNYDLVFRRFNLSYFANGLQSYSDTW